MLITRLLSAAVGIPLLILVVAVGGYWYDATLTVALGAATAEVLLSAQVDVREPLLWLAALFAASLPLAARGGLLWPPGVLAAFVLLSLSRLALRGSDSIEPRSWLLTVGIAVYIGWLGMHLALLRHLASGRSWVFIALFTTFASDTGAYAVGRLVGRHKLAPRVSPAKTVEGAIGGVVTAAIVAPLLSLLLGPSEQVSLLVLLGVAISIAAQMGDLAESALKRSLKLKDAGRLVPGHGGLLDRLDSLLFAGAVLYYLVRWISL